MSIRAKRPIPKQPDVMSGSITGSRLGVTSQCTNSPIASAVPLARRCYARLAFLRLTATSDACSRSLRTVERSSNLPRWYRQSTEVNDLWQTKIKAAEAAINRSAAVPVISRMIHNAPVKQEKKVANILTEAKTSRSNPVRGDLNKGDQTRIRINGPAVGMIRTERVGEPDLPIKVLFLAGTLWVPAFFIVWAQAAI